eukprot:5645545-Amphidinium_carterae.2
MVNYFTRATKRHLLPQMPTGPGSMNWLSETRKKQPTATSLMQSRTRRAGKILQRTKGRSKTAPQLPVQFQDLQRSRSPHELATALIMTHGAITHSQNGGNHLPILRPEPFYLDSEIATRQQDLDPPHRSTTPAIFALVDVTLCSQVCSRQYLHVPHRSAHRALFNVIIV